MFNFLKLTPELSKAVGAKDETPEAFVTALSGVTTRISTAEAKVAELTQTVGEMSDLIQTMTVDFKKVSKPALSAEEKAALIEEAKTAAKAAGKTEGSRAAVEALAQTGSATPVQAGAVQNQEAAKPIDQLQAAGEFEKAWALSEELQSDFPTAKDYAVWAKKSHKSPFRN